jgi:hypothetical protein
MLVAALLMVDVLALVAVRMEVRRAAIVPVSVQVHTLARQPIKHVSSEQDQHDADAELEPVREL